MVFHLLGVKTLDQSLQQIIKPVRLVGSLCHILSSWTYYPTEDIYAVNVLQSFKESKLKNS